MADTIGSIKDERITLARALKASRGRFEHGRVLLEGAEILDWAVAYGLRVEYILATANLAASVESKYGTPDCRVYSVSDGILKKVTDTNYLVPVVGVAQLPASQSGRDAEFVVVLDEVKDLGNIGTVIRTCHAFGIAHLVATNEDFDIYHRKTIEASRGSVFATDVTRFGSSGDSIAYLKRRGYQIVATSPRGSALQSMVELERRPVALIVGNEANGISPEFEEQADLLIQIPMSNTVESLNVGVATGISIYELRLKQVLTMMEDRIRSTLGRELNVTGQLVREALDVDLRRITELTSQQVVFMMVLRCDGHMSTDEMCRQFGVLEGDVESFLAAPLKAGLVAIAEDLTLTARGEDALAKLWPAVDRAEQKLLADFTTDEVQVLMAQLRRIRAQCCRVIDGEV
jgi:RNA methyltransferase, TrmH family